eukprot:TRINITY_DN1615_c0_g1_i13.p1 TRINITY_DN1615_c0_g1~~TRINITY_DN1615_c0_g1_i13.p1  ORF type:complete len:488 (+),score=89.43 TRINITY_DN1615_c0_g1_i13:97-1464(+)
MTPNGSLPAQKDKKKSKKDKTEKKKRKLLLEEQQDQVKGDLNGTACEEPSNEKPKKRKLIQQESGKDELIVNQVEQNGGQEKKKKKKKNKEKIDEKIQKSVDSESDLATSKTIVEDVVKQQLAQVGNVDLANNSQSIIKNIYNKHKITQTKPISKGVEIVVGTPGRVEDLVQEGSCSLRQVTFVVLDEADRMLDLGFEPSMRSIIGRTRADRQTLMFSATWPESVRKLASEFLCNPVKVQVGSKEISAAKSVQQKVEVIEDSEKLNRLIKILQQHQKKRTSDDEKMKIIIFVLYKKEAPHLEAALNKRGFKAVAVHGDASQQKRQEAVNQFKENNVPILVATDVAARGLDIPDVQMVINYTFPLTIEDYVHRIGRTGRAGKSGLSHTFFCPRADKSKAGELVNVLREAGQKVPEELLKFGTAVKKKESKVYGAHFKEVDMSQKATRMTFDDSDQD